MNKVFKVFLDNISSSSYVPAEVLAGYRIIFGSLLLCYFLPSWSWLKAVPPAFFDPHILSFAYLTDSQLDNFIYLGADIVIICFLVMLSIGLWTRWVLIGIFLLCAIFYSYSYSFGKIDHHTSILIFTFLLMAFTNCGSHFALLKDKSVNKDVQKTALVVISVSICFGFFTAGISKFIRWIDFDLNTSGFLSWFNTSYYLGEKEKYFLMDYVFKMPVLLLESMDYMAAIYEISGFLFLVRGKKYWLIFLFISGVFHFSTLLLLNIDFTLTLLVYGIFSISPLFKRFNKKDSLTIKNLQYFFYAIIAVGIL
ncbi:MAG: hypothetical protein ACFB0A_15665 [Croceivirga sp.]